MTQIKITNIILHRFKQYTDRSIKIPEGFCLLAGSNNSGKSSFMQAFSLWEFCKSVIEMEYGREGLLNEKIGIKQGIGINGEDFLPINLPSLKHMWTNLRVAPEEDIKGEKEPDGYTMWIEVQWTANSDDLKSLRFSLSITNDRLFIKTTKSNITREERLPKIAYIPPFAGILNREPFHTKAMRARLIGQGLSGSVMRNTLLELHRINNEKRKALKGEKDKIPNKELATLRSQDPWEHLIEICRRIFNLEIVTHDFNEEYHSYIKVESWKGAYNDKKTKFDRYPKFNNRDIMVEGSGFLQLLNVISLSLDPSYDVIFLDEPDAHLHSSLQRALFEELKKLANKYKKQVMFATHSTELIKLSPISNILKFENGKATLLTQEAQRVSLIVGLGSEHNITLDKIQQTKKILFVENESDSILIFKLGEKIGIEPPSDFALWASTETHAEKLRLFKQLRTHMPEIKAISIRDRDTQHHNEIGDNLETKGSKKEDNQFQALTWRYRYIESYLLNPISIAKAANKEKDEIIENILQKFSIDLSRYKTDSIIPALRDFESKEIISYIEKTFHVTKYVIANNMTADEIHDDIKLSIKEIKSKLN